MSQLLIKKILDGCRTVRISPTRTSNLGFLPDPNVLLLRSMSSTSNRQSFTVSYLVSSLGFSSQTALSASKHVNFYTPDNPDKVIKVFKDYGFTHTQISSLVRIFPAVLTSKTEKTVLPKLEFLKSKGLSGTEMAKMLPFYPTLLRSSLTKQIMPAYDFYRDFFQSDAKANAAVRRYPDILTRNVEKHVVPNINILREYGVPDFNTAALFHYQPKAFVVSSDKLRKIVQKVKEMGFDASQFKFVVAVFSFRALSRSKWESKISAYKKWGWSEEDVLNAFQRHPWCIMISEVKINLGMDFFINKMGLSPCVIAKRPVLLSLSLKKRLIPRFLVFQILLSKGLAKKEVGLSALLETPEKKFLQKFVAPYKEEAPELLKLYKEKLNLSNDEINKLSAALVGYFLALNFLALMFKAAAFDRNEW